MKKTDPGNFVISGTTGQISVKSGATIDYETATSYQVTVRGEDSGGSVASSTVKILVSDVNERPAFTSTSMTVAVAEDAAVNAAVGAALAATDPDAGQTLFYSITSGNSAGMFLIDTIGGQVRVGKALDYETTTSYTLGVKIEDNGSPKLSATGTVTVNVNDANEPPVFTAATVTKSVDENSADATVVTDLSAIASDPEDDEITFALLSGNFNDIFAVSKNAATKKSSLVVAAGKGAELDHEGTKPSFTLEVQASDAEESSTFSLVVNVADVAEAPAFVYEDGADESEPIKRAINENAASGTKIGAAIVAKDQDDGDELTYSITSQTTGNYFAIGSKTGQLTAAKTLPTATGSSTKFTVSVSVSDKAGNTDTATVEVGLENTNDPPKITGSTVTVNENTAVGTAVANAFSASDPDGHSLSYQLVSGANGAFSIDAAGKLSVAGDLDYETRNKYTMVISVTDQPGADALPLSASATVVINVKDLNEPPTLPSGLLFTVSEAAAKGDKVGTDIVATDQDTGETFTFAITKGDDGDAFAISDAGRITVNDPSEIDYESTKTFALDVTCTDSGSNKVTTTARIEVVNANDAPKLVIVDPNITVAEDTAVGTKLATLQATDEDAGDVVSFEVSGGDTAVFKVVPSSGAVLLDAALNYETRKTYTLSVYGQDSGGLRSSGTLYFTVGDSPDPPKYTGPASVDVDEHSARGSTVFTATATDEDANEKFTYAITSGNDNGLFEIDPALGTVKVRDSDRLNYESFRFVDVTVTVTDKDRRTDSGKTRINLKDVNEAPAVTTTALSVAEVDSVDAAGAPFYSVVGSPVGAGPVEFTDEDNGQNHTIRIVSGNPSGMFAFGEYVSAADLLSGTPSPVTEASDATSFGRGFMLYVRNSTGLDFEGPLNSDGRAVVSLVVEVKDTGVPAQTARGTIEVDITNRNERPTLEQEAVRSIDENSPVNAIIGEPLAASDPDLGDILSFRIESGNEDRLFKIDPCGGQLKVSRDALNFEARSLYHLVVSVSDDGATTPGPARLSDMANVTVRIKDVNEPPRVIPASRSVDENTVSPASFGAALEVSDEDFAQGHTWAIVDEDSDAVGLFDIDSETGVLKVKTTLAGHREGLDYEFDDSFAITVRATDNGTRPANLFSEAKINIKLNDVNEPPVVPDNQNVSVPENSQPGTAVDRRVEGDDFDAGSSVTFSVVEDGSLGSRLFVIDPLTGLLTVAPIPAAAPNGTSLHPELDYEVRRSTWLTVRVNDSRLFTDARVNILISDVNEPPTLHEAVLNVSESSLAGAEVAGSPLVATDVDTDQRVSFRISEQNPAGAFAVDALTGVVSVSTSARLDFETVTTHFVTVVATDDGKGRLTSTRTFEVAILDAPERPVMDDSAGTVAENSLGGVAVCNMTATDVDVGDTQLFEITAANPPGIRDAFSIGASTGYITVAPGTASGDINFEAHSTGKVTLTVKVTDSYGLSTTATATVTITDVAEAPVFRPPAKIFKAARTAGPVGQSLTSYVVDEDIGDSHSFDRVTVTPKDPNFELGGFGLLSIPADIASSNDFQTGATYAYTIEVTDSFGLTGQGVLNIEFTDNNIAPTLDATEFLLDENVADAHVVGHVSADDLNKDDAIPQDVSYTIAPVAQSLNRPFPFNISTVPGGIGGLSRGEIYVTDGSVVNFEERPIFYAAVLVTDNHPTTPLQTQAIITIRVQDVDEAPAFATGTVASAVTENVAPGTQVGTVPLSAFDPDAKDVGLLRYTWTDAGSAATFSLNASTGVVTVAAGATMDHEAVPSYTLGARVTDTTGLTDTVSLTVTVVDVNEMPTFAFPSAVTLSEAAGVNAEVARMTATDQDEGSWGVLSFFMTDDDGAMGAFRVDASSGRVLVDKVVDDDDERKALLDFEDRTVYRLGVGVRDAGGLNRTGTVTVTLSDANDIELVGFLMRSDATGRAVVPAGSMGAQGAAFDPYAALDADRIDVLAPTVGGVRVWMVGRGFGPTARKLSEELGGVTPAEAHTFRATAVSRANRNNTLSASCALVNDTHADCSIPAGAGSQWSWEVEVVGTAQVYDETTRPAWQLRRPLTGYIAPNVTRVYRPDFTASAPVFMPTLGGSTFRVVGTDLGDPAQGFSQIVRYGPVAALWDESYGPFRREDAVACRSVAAHTEIECTSRPGLGAMLEFYARVEGQDSPSFVADVDSDGMRYANPSVGSVLDGDNATTPAGGARLQTAGGDSLVIRGANFGPDRVVDVAVWYGEAGFGLPESATPLSAPPAAASSDLLRFEATSCRVSGGGHDTITCKSAEGVGRDHVFAVAMRGLASGVPASSAAAGTAVASYLPPTVASANGPGWRASPTKGGVAFSVEGSQYGPAGLVVPVVRYGPVTNPTKYTASGCAVSAAHQEITCNTAPGSGFGHMITLTVRGQSVSFRGNVEEVPVDEVKFELGTDMRTVSRAVGLAYAPPVVTRYDGAGASDANTKGSEKVVIEGLDFGPVTRGIERITYGLDNSSTEYAATNCSLTQAHTKITCETAEGAGAGLRWVVWIDGQRSRSPTTDYHEPVISELRRPGAADAYTDGSQTVDIVGRYFGPSSPSYLEDVTYGRTGREFVADNCTVVSHNLVRCATTAGTGRGLRWRMAVRGQDSGLSTVTSNYADPDVRTVLPSTGSTEGSPQTRLFGLDFGIREKRVGQDFKFSQAANVTFNPANNLTTRTIPGLRGAVPCNDRMCLLWDNRYLLAVENASDWTQGAPRAESAHSVAFHVPEGAGKDIPMQLVLKTGPGGKEAFGEVHSNVVFWSYMRPVISSDIGKDRVRLNGRVQIKLNVAGEHFSSTPQVYIYDSEESFSLARTQNSLDSLLVPCTVVTPHREVECVQDREIGVVRIGAGGQFSDPRSFDRDTPTIGNLEGSNWEDLLLPTAGGHVLSFEVHSIDKPTFAMSIEGQDCTSLVVTDPYRKPEALDPLNREWNRITCVTPQGAGREQRLSISAAGLTPPPQLVNFAPPTVLSWRAVTDADSSATLAPGLPPTSGSLIEVRGGNFSNFSLSCADLATCAEAQLGLFHPAAAEGLPELPLEQTFEMVSWDHDRIVARVSEGEGLGFLLRVTAAGQADSTSFAYAPPVISAHTRSGPTSGGVDLVIGGANFGVSTPTVTMRRLGGRAFRSDGVTPWSAADVVVDCPVSASSHTSATCTLPAGQGRFWIFSIRAAGQVGSFAYTFPSTAAGDATALDAQAFAYAPPVLGSLEPVEGPTQGSFLTTLAGSNLGTAELELMVRVPDSVPITEEDWSSAVTMPLSPEGALADAAAGRLWLHGETMAAHAAAIEAAAADPEAALAALPSQAWRDAILTVATDGGSDTLDADEASPVAIAVASLLAAHNGTHTHTSASFAFPEGQGATIEVRVNVAGQPSNTLSFVYERPNVTMIKLPKEINTEGSWPADDREAIDREVITLHGSSFGLNSTQRTKVMLFRPAAEYQAGAAPSARALSLAASAFYPTPEEEADAIECDTAVLQNGMGLWMGADSKVYSHTQVSCPVPAGWGRELRLVVKVMDRYSEPWSFSYDPADVDFFTPNTPSALGTQVMSIYGKNFGPEPTALDIKIGGIDCNGSSWTRDSTNRGKPYLKCIVSEDEAGVRNMTIFVAGQDADPVASDGRLRLRCPYNWYGIEETCLRCPIGGICKGDLEWPYADAGFWDLKPNNTVEANDPYRGNCPAERLDSEHRSFCFYPVGCKPREACQGNNTCTYGYEGIRCKDCLKGKFYRRAGECVKCPELPLVQLIAFAIAIVAAGCGAYAFQRFKVHLASVQIAIDYMQVLAMIARAKVPWPPLIREILYILSAFNLNLEIAAPECLFPELGYPLKWAAVAVLPIAAFVMFGMLHMFIVFKKICLGRDRKKLCNHSPSFSGSMLMLGLYAFMVEARNSLSVFNCSPVVPDDGFTYMEDVIERCWEPNGMQMFLAPFAAGALLLYTIGYPALLAYLLYTRRDRVRQDQILRVHGIGDSRLTNPKAYVLRKYLSKLYQHFRPELYAWVLIILARKAFISVVALMFRENPAYQLACALLVMFVAYALQVRFIPYMPPSTYDAELARYQRLVTEGSPMHNSIANVIAPALAHMRHMRRQKQRSMWGLDAPSLRKVAVTNFFDYNSVEAILLGCGVFTCLAGIMFQSGAFELSYRPEVAAQAETITWVLTVVLVVSLLYIVAVVGNEAYSQCERTKKVTAKKGGGKKGGKKGGKLGAGAAAAGAAGGDDDLLADGDIVASAAHTSDKGNVTSDSAQLNPMFMSGDGGAGGIATSAAHIVDSDAAPDSASWQVVRTEFGKIQAENSELKRQLEQAQAGGGSKTGMASSRMKQRFTHSPMRAATAATAEERLGAATEAPGANPLFKKAGGKSGRAASRGRLLGKKARPSIAVGSGASNPMLKEAAPSAAGAAAASDSAKATFEPARVGADDQA